MDFAQLVQAYFERAVALQNYWTLYVVVIGGLLAVSTLRKTRNPVTTILVSILYVCFAYRNAGAITETIAQRDSFYTSLVSLDQKLGEKAERKPGAIYTLPPPAATGPSGAVGFHLLCDGLVLVTLWGMEWRRRREGEEILPSPPRPS